MKTQSPADANFEECLTASNPFWPLRQAAIQTTQSTPANADDLTHFAVGSMSSLSMAGKTAQASW